VDPIADIQVFAPVYKGALGIDAPTRRLRDALNPGGRRCSAAPAVWRDKADALRRNLHELG